jgi:arginyl-tRNA synthetase
MITLRQELSKRLQRSISRLWPELPLQENIEVTPATQRQFGDYQCNMAMRMANICHMAPRQIAEKIAKDLQTHETELLAQVDVAGPGFINLRLSDTYLATRLSAFSLSDLRSKASKCVVVDFSSPNIAKEMHVGHLRSTILGDCLARLFEETGALVHRVNHIGDWGTQFGMLIASLELDFGKEALETMIKESQKGVISWDLPFLMRAYQQSKQRFDADSEFAQKAKLRVVDLQAHEPFSYALWKLICEVSRRGYQEIYTLLNVRIEECGESFYNPMLQPLIQELEAKGCIEISQGAKCIFVDGFDIPVMIQKSDGGFNYDSTDMAALKYRIETLKADQIVVLTDAGQKLHFDLVFGAAKKADLLPDSVQAIHVPFGLVLGPDGKKFRTRSGQTEKLIDLIREAIERARAILNERGMEPGQDLEDLAVALGVNAIKYSDLSNYRLSDYSFSYDKMLKFEGNTAAFLMYSYVRTLSVLKKAGADKSVKMPLVDLEPGAERQLALSLLQLPEAIETTLRDLAPNRLSDYVYSLSQDFNAFFRDCRVEGHERQQARVALVQRVEEILGKSIELLGLRLVSRM